MKKKRILLALSALLVLGMSFGVTYAYLTASDAKVNAFKTGDNTITIDEDFPPPDNLGAGVDLMKKVKITNTGTIPCFVRVMVEFSDSNAEAFCELRNLDGPEKDHQGRAIFDPYPDVLRDSHGTPIEDIITDGNTAQIYWVKYGDYYYYREPLNPGESTVQLFSVIHLLDDLDEADLMDFDVYIYAESREYLDNDFTDAWEIDLDSGGDGS